MGGIFLVKNDFFGIKKLANLRVLILIALFSTMSFILGKFLAITVGNMRFSFENLPILLCGILFGPVSGCLCGIIADIVGCILYGYSINPIITLGAASIGFLSGFISVLFRKSKLGLRAFVSVLIPHVTGSLIIKTLGLCFWYDYPFFLTLGLRSINYIIVGSAEFVLLYILLNNRGFCGQINRIIGVRYDK